MKNFVKVLCAVLAATFIASALCVFSFADGSVTYKGQSEKFIFAPGSDKSPTDLFDAFKGVMPGDSLTQKVVVKNDKSSGVKVKIYMKSTGAWEDSEEFLSQLKLTVKAADKALFDAAANETAGLTDWLALGTLEAGAETTLDLTLTVPADLDNKFQNSIGKLDWQFKVEELPEEKPAPKTGEDFNYPLYIALAVCAVVVMASTVVYVAVKRKKHEND